MRVERATIQLVSVVAAIPVLVWAIFWLASVSFKAETALAQGDENKKDVGSVKEDISSIKGDIREIKVMLRGRRDLRTDR